MNPYAFEMDYPEDLLTKPDGTQYAMVRSAPVWGGNINGYGAGDGRMISVRALVLHTPEEAADNKEQTPIYFGTTGVQRSTHDYLDNDGDLYQMVSHRDAAWGQGTHEGNRVWKGHRYRYAPWNPEHISNNQLSLGIEIEGFAGTIHRTLGRAQYATLARWIAYNATRYSIPLDRDHIVGHYELARDKTDPGKLPIDDLIASAKMLIEHGIAVYPDTVVETVTEEFDLKPLLELAYKRGRVEGFMYSKDQAKEIVDAVLTEAVGVAHHRVTQLTLPDADEDELFEATADLMP